MLVKIHVVFDCCIYWFLVKENLVFRQSLVCEGFKRRILTHMDLRKYYISVRNVIIFIRDWGKMLRPISER